MSKESKTKLNKKTLGTFDLVQANLTEAKNHLEEYINTEKLPTKLNYRALMILAGNLHNLCVDFSRLVDDHSH